MWVGLEGPEGMRSGDNCWVVTESQGVGVDIGVGVRETEDVICCKKYGCILV